MKKKLTKFFVNSNKIAIDPYLNEKCCSANEIFVDSTKYFSGCKIKIIDEFFPAYYLNNKIFRFNKSHNYLHEIRQINSRLHENQILRTSLYLFLFNSMYS